ncbi:MAG: HAD family phosphatase [Oscillibacter sp.]|nr:HAD family phosphatase [Oscillibacter sp.]
MIKLIAADMDGTLLDSRKNLPPDFEAWVESHPEIRVAIASGRQYYTLYGNFSPAVRDKLLYIAENGALVFERGETLYRNVMETADVLACLRAAQGLPWVYPILCGVKSAWTVRAPENVEAQARTYYRRLAYLETLESALGRDDFVKIALYVEGYKAAETVSRFRGLEPRLHPVVSGPDWIDVANASVSKGAALRSIQGRYGIAADECAAFGDYMNDYALLQAVGESYAMANACAELKAVAKYVTASNDEDGVMKVLRAF